MKTAKLPALLVLSAAWLGTPSCSDNPAAYQGILGTTRTSSEPSPSTGGGGAGGTGGSAGTGGAAAGTPANGTGGGPGEGGMGAVGDGGTGATSGGTAGSGTAGGGTAGSGMAGAVNPPTHPDFSPACFLYTTTLGEEILKGTSCTAADPKLCYRPCGPNQVGWKTETCTAGVYAEGDCTFPADGDYSCYAIPDEIDVATCGLSAPPAATDPCEAPLCTTCNYDGFYQDTGSDVKEGYCVCRTPDTGGVRRWTCASATAWPCPLNQGC